MSIDWDRIGELLVFVGCVWLVGYVGYIIGRPKERDIQNSIAEQRERDAARKR
jgi:hypothetical protein